MQSLFFRTLAPLALLFFCGLHHAQAADPPIAQLKSFLKETHTLSSAFKQITVGEKGIIGRENSGIFLLQRPGRFRWDYQSPYQQMIVSNGEKVWYYDVDLEQVTVRKTDIALGSAPALLLSGQVELETNFMLEAVGLVEGLSWVKLTPKSEESAFQYIMIGMDENSLNAMELSDNFGQLTRIFFSDIVINQPIDPQKFTPTLPAGVDIFEEK